MSEMLQHFVKSCGLPPEKILFRRVPSADGLEQQGFRISTQADKMVITSPSITGWVAGVSELEEFGIQKADINLNPSFHWRSHQRWLPFELGQKAYGQQGYDYFDKNENSWWFDRNFWTEYLLELARGRYNAIHMWNVHPYPALIRFKKYPYAAYFTPQRVEKNIEQFSWIVNSAQQLGIKIVLMQYNIHVSAGYAQRHGYPWIDDCGWGGKDTPEVRRYTRHCLEELFELYPDLGGLMTAGELNKDAFDFYRETIIPVIKAAGNHCHLHFRLWGQQDPDGIKKLVELTAGQIQLWHKISHEQIWIPKADSRFAQWRRLLPDVPLNASCGPGMAAGLNYVEKVHYDPQFWLQQFSHLKLLGATGFGYFTGADNHLRHPGEYEHQQHAQWARWYAAGPSRQAVGKIAWQLDSGDSKNRRWPAHLAQYLDQPLAIITDIYELALAVNSTYTQMTQILGMYNSQDLGFARTLGFLSAGTEKENPGSFCFVACCAWPDDGFGVDVPDVRQLAVDLRATPQGQLVETYIDRFAKSLAQLDQLAAQHHLPQQVLPRHQRPDYRLACFFHYLKHLALVGLFKAQAMKAAVAAYRAPFVENVVEHLQQAVDHIDQCLLTLEHVAAELALGWAVETTIHRELSDWNIGQLFRNSLTCEKQHLLELITALGGEHLSRNVYCAYGRSVYWYNQAYRYLRHHGGYHHEPQVFQKADECMTNAIAELDGHHHQTINIWRTFLQNQSDRTHRADLNLPVAGPEITLPLQWPGRPFNGPLKYVDQMHQLLDPAQLQKLPLRIQPCKQVTVQASPAGLIVRFPALFDKHYPYLPVDESLAPHEKISPDIYRENDHYQLSLSLPDRPEVLNLKIVPRDKTLQARRAWLNSPHGMKTQDLPHDSVQLNVDDQSVRVSVPWQFYGAAPQPGQTWRLNLAQTRDFWEFVVAAWSPISDCVTFLDYSQSGFVHWI